MEIVIKLPKKIYKSIRDNNYCGIIDSDVYNAIANGTPLPKGHGRLIDVDAIVSRLKEHKKFYVDSYGWLFRFMPTEYKARCDEIDSCWADIVNAPTVIEADKAESEEKE